VPGPLPATGTSVAPVLVALGVLLVAVGLVGVASTRRSRPAS
jgi:LPXTG-motif cell wall-anchored protein